MSISIAAIHLLFLINSMSDYYSVLTECYEMAKQKRNFVKEKLKE